MTTLTIQDVVDANPARTAQKILRCAIMHLSSGHAEWDTVVSSARRSPLVNNSGHPHSKTMKSVSVSQILDRMNVGSLTVLLTRMMDTGGVNNALYSLAETFR